MAPRPAPAPSPLSPLAILKRGRRKPAWALRVPAVPAVPAENSQPEKFAAWQVFAGITSAAVACRPAARLYGETPYNPY